MKNGWFIACCLFALFCSAQTATHQVVKGETLYAIAKKHHVKVTDLARINHLDDDMKVKPGQVLKLPKASASKPETVITPTAASKPKPAAPKNTATESNAPKTYAAPVPTTESSGNSARIIHEVQKGETLYAIAKNYGVKVSLLKELNQLDDDLKIRLGQKLLIRMPDSEAMYQKPVPTPTPPPVASPAPPQRQKETETVPVANTPIAPAAPVARPVETTGYSSEARDKAIAEQQRRDSAKSEAPQAPATANPDDYETLYNQYATQGKSKRTIRGLGTFLHSSSTPGNQFLALYNYAETGSIIKITNLMSKRTIFVKVIGKVPGNEAQTDVVLKVSQQAADVLKVSEEKFLVEVAAYN